MKRVLTLLYHDVYGADPEESGFPGHAARRYKIPLPAFERQLARLEAAVESPPPTALGPRGTSMKTPFVITVDDGGVSYYTRVAERLEMRGWRGHCFMTTAWIGRPGFLDATQLRALHARGHVIGSHSVSHPRRFAACSWDEMLREWSESRKVLQDILGAEVTSASVPGGYFSARVACAAHAAGFTTLFTSEPQTRIRDIGGCRVFGRYTLRYGSPADLPARLARGELPVRCAEWLSWNAKKTLKVVLGAGYPRLAARFTHPGR